MIYTSYFAKVARLPDGCVPVSIALRPPTWYTGATYPTLAPTPKILRDYKSCPNIGIYVQNYTEDVLERLLPEQVVAALTRLTVGGTPVLLCYERAGDFCHRRLVSAWLSKHGYPCEELIL